jgi:hypothetical protein
MKLLNECWERAIVSTSDPAWWHPNRRISLCYGQGGMVYENVKNMKLEVTLDDTMLTLWDAITRRVQWRTYIIVDPSATASAQTTASQPNTAPGLIFPETRQSPSLIQEQSCSSRIREQLHPSSLQTWSTPLPTPDQTQPPTASPKTVKSVRAKTQP